MREFWHSFKEVITAIIPVVVIIFILSLVFAPFDRELLISFIGGTVMMVFGMALFLFGANFSMMQVGSRVGSYLIQKRNIWFLVLVTFIIGIVITVAEPDVQVLAIQVSEVSKGSIEKMVLVSWVGLGVGIFTVLGILRIIFQWKLMTILLSGYALVFATAIFSSPTFIPVAFDSGGVTTGPITVPFILALASGVTSVIRTKAGANDSFGLVGLASIGPVMAVLILGLIYR
ncbi:MAG: DUF1538 domain-containing protein [Sporomusaceae bacterium]|jgi:hypothetical protein|nr:DUF1538 domain-containing protein [Sporomusaceae bacterium]